MPPTATFIVATYGRPDTLSVALKSVLHQETGDWEIVVVGDACGPETAEAVAAIGDHRIRYYNLPRRYGEQGGPNSAGLEVANGKYVGFLNHDDVLLADFLTSAVETMRSGRQTFHVARFATVESVAAGRGGTRPVFTGLTPPHTSPRVLMEHDWSTFEPASSWLVDTDLARRIGPWTHSSELYCWPLRDWALRACRHGGRFGFGRRVTGVRFWSHNRHAANIYRFTSPEHMTVGRWLETMSPEELRAFIQRDLDARADAPTDPSRRRWHRSVQQSIALQRYRLTGTDAVTAARCSEGRPKGEAAAWLLKRRTGETDTDRAGLREFLADPEAHRVV